LWPNGPQDPKRGGLMPEGKLIPVQPGEYPELDNLPEGSKVKFEGEAELTKDGLLIKSIDLQTDNDATRELSKMIGQPSGGTEGDTGDSGF